MVQGDLTSQSLHSFLAPTAFQMPGPRTVSEWPKFTSGDYMGFFPRSVFLRGEHTEGRTKGKQIVMGVGDTLMEL